MINRCELFDKHHGRRKSKWKNKEGGHGMRKGLSVFLVFTMLALTLVSGLGTAVFATEMNWDEFRIAGADRYETAHEIAKLYNPNPERVLIVRGDDAEGMPQIIDGLTAGGLAGVENAPILLVRKDTIPGKALAALEDLDPQEAWIIGGVEAVSNVVEQQIKDLGIITERIAGENRYETAAEIALNMGFAKGGIGIITNGNNENLVDSLTAGPLATQGHPILLVNNQRGLIPPCTLEAIEELGIEELIIIGGTSAVSQEIEDALNDLQDVSVLARLGGSNRYETSALVSQLANFDELNDYSLVNGYGTRFVDAVAASTLGAPILYFNGEREEIPTSVIAALRLKENFWAIGGPMVTPDSIIERAYEVIGVPLVMPTVSVVFGLDSRINSEGWIPESNVNIESTRGGISVLSHSQKADGDGMIGMYLPGFSPAYEPMAGDLLTMTDNDERSVEYEILLIDVTKTDAGENRVEGLADPGQEVEVYIDTGYLGDSYDEMPRIFVEANHDGEWSVDFTGEFDISEWNYGGAMVHDEEGNNSIYYWDAYNPHISVYPHENNVSGFGWGVEVTLTVNGIDTYSIYTDTGYFDFVGFGEGEVIIEGGDDIEVTDGATTYTFVVAELEMTDVDRSTGKISGTAAPDGEVEFTISTPWMAPGGGPPTIVVSETLTVDAQGEWSYDYKQPVEADDDIYAIVQCEVYEHLVQTVDRDLGDYSSP